MEGSTLSDYVTTSDVIKGQKGVQVGAVQQLYREAYA